MYKMRVFVICLALSIAMATPTVDLDAIFDKDMEKILSDDGKRQELVDCLLDKGPCGDYQSLRDNAPEIINTSCGNCTPQAKEKFGKSIKIIADKYPEQFKAIMDKYQSKS